MKTQTAFFFLLQIYVHGNIRPNDRILRAVLFLQLFPNFRNVLKFTFLFYCWLSKYCLKHKKEFKTGQYTDISSHVHNYPECNQATPRASPGPKLETVNLITRALSECGVPPQLKRQSRGLNWAGFHLELCCPCMCIHVSPCQLWIS
jgi:hypothetical protein